MSADASKAKQLLYISDGQTYDVYIYAFPALKLTGKLTGFSLPQGECSDTNGDVWITNTQTEQILEFKPGETHPARAITDPSGYPVGCAIDAATGNLAVTNIFGFGGPGNVLIYRNARGTPAFYANRSQYYYYFAAYDSTGDLYASGKSSKGSYWLSVLHRGKSSMSTVVVSGGTIHVPGAVVWAKPFLILGDQDCEGRHSSCFYETSVSGTTAKVTGTTRLNGSCDVAQALVEGGRLVGGDDQRCGHGKSSVDVWPYPRGGNPTNSATGVAVPVGAAISTQ
jgi:hypothetical protein